MLMSCLGFTYPVHPNHGLNPTSNQPIEQKFPSSRVICESFIQSREVPIPAFEIVDFTIDVYRVKECRVYCSIYSNGAVYNVTIHWFKYLDYLGRRSSTTRCVNSQIV